MRGISPPEKVPKVEGNFADTTQGPRQSGLDHYVAGNAAPGGQDFLAEDAHGQPGREAHLGTLVSEKAATGGPVKQSGLRRATKKKWADRIISLLAPYFSHMHPVAVGEDKYEEWHPLVGKTRTNSLKSVFYGLKKLRSILAGSPLPIMEEMTKRLLHKAVDEQFTVYKLSQLWRILHCIPDHFGGYGPTVDSVPKVVLCPCLLPNCSGKEARQA